MTKYIITYWYYHCSAVLLLKLPGRHPELRAACADMLQSLAPLCAIALKGEASPKPEADFLLKSELTYRPAY
jgi:hypothetical protein